MKKLIIMFFVILIPCALFPHLYIEAGRYSGLYEVDNGHILKDGYPCGRYIELKDPESNIDIIKIEVYDCFVIIIIDNEKFGVIYEQITVYEKINNDLKIDIKIIKIPYIFEVVSID